MKNRYYTITDDHQVIIKYKSNVIYKMMVNDLALHETIWQELRRIIRFSIVNDLFIETWHKTTYKGAAFRNYYGG